MFKSLAMLLGLTTLPLIAQTNSGTILGTIRDSQDAIVTTATITILNTATGVVTYSTFYEIPGGRSVLGAESKIAFPEKEDLAEMLDEAGLLVERWLGDWDGEPYVATSAEIIPIGRLR